jgi:hypothetical protein
MCTQTINFYTNSKNINENSGSRVLAVEQGWDPRDKYPDLLKGLGKMDVEFTIKLQKDAIPITAATHRRVPHPLWEQTRKKLEQLEAMDVISKVTEPTPWCGYMLVVPKPESKDIRITIDNSGLAKAVIRDSVILPSVKETLAKMGGAKIFSKLDARDGFWQIPLSESFRNLTTFCTPWGRYKFNRLFMGCTSASEFFHITMSNLLDRFEGVVVYIDKILIWVKNQTEHDLRLEAVLQRLKKAGVTLNFN